MLSAPGVSRRSRFGRSSPLVALHYRHFPARLGTPRVPVVPQVPGLRLPPREAAMLVDIRLFALLMR
jgi:hypothetical protein